MAIMLNITSVTFGASIPHIDTIKLPHISPQYKQNMSVVIMNAQTGQIVYALNMNHPRLVASNLKLLTSAVALSTLSPNFQWQTRLGLQGHIINHTLIGNVYILGGGDPTFTNNDLTKLLHSLHAMQINQIQGNVIIDDSIFNENVTFSMLQQDHYDVDTIIPHGLMVDGGVTQFNIHVKHATVSITSNVYGYPIINNLQVDPNMSVCPDLSRQINFVNKQIIFNGLISPKCNNTTLTLNLIDYSHYIAMKVMQDLDAQHIKFANAIIFDTAPTTINIIAAHNSQTLAQTLIAMNHYSINLIAETLLLSLGAWTTSNHDTYQQGRQVYLQYMHEQHLSNAHFYLENGSGLSRFEYITAKTLAHLLWIMSHSNKLHDVFENSLPRGGAYGTLHNQFLEYGNRVRLKTGTLNDTSAYSGYFYTRHRQKYIIVIIANHINDHNSLLGAYMHNWLSSTLHQLDQ